MKKVWLFFTLLFGSLLIAWCNKTAENPEIIDEPENYSCSITAEDQYSCSESVETNETYFTALEENANNIQIKLWGLTPEDALEYMKNTEDLIIIDTRDLEVLPNGFVWSIAIPRNQIADRVREIPEWAKVLLHCGWGGVAPKAYQALLEVNPKLESLAYIAWTPLFDEYNNLFPYWRSAVQSEPTWENDCIEEAKKRLKEMNPDNEFLNIQWSSDMWEKVWWSNAVTNKWLLYFRNTENKWIIDFYCTINIDEWGVSTSYWTIHLYDLDNDILAVSENKMSENLIYLKVWDKTFDITLVDNSSTKALLEKLKEWDIVVNAHDYWNFEKVWELGFDLPTNDEQITTEAWDLILYLWHRIVVYYDTNSWNFTRLWKVHNITKSDLWDWDVTLIFSLIN